ncbi:MAG: hypothetical protein QM784_05925 [Polyangiaceae bacterium]
MPSFVWLAFAGRAEASEEVLGTASAELEARFEGASAAFVVCAADGCVAEDCVAGFESGTADGCVADDCAADGAPLAGPAAGGANNAGPYSFVHAAAKIRRCTIGNVEQHSLARPAGGVDFVDALAVALAIPLGAPAFVVAGSPGGVGPIGATDADALGVGDDSLVGRCFEQATNEERAKTVKKGSAREVFMVRSR